MKKSLEVDVTDLSDILESFVKKLDTMAEADLIDLAARLKPAAKACETIDKFVKDLVKAKLKHNEGSRLGAMFKAVLKVIPVNRFQQTKFKEAYPDMYVKFSEDKDEERVTFELR